MHALVYSLRIHIPRVISNEQQSNASLKNIPENNFAYQETHTIKDKITPINVAIRR